MTNTYTVNARNSVKGVCVDVSLTVNSVHQACAFYKILTEAFRSADIVDNNTGEVIMSIYSAEEFFYPRDTLTSVLERVEELRIEFLAR